MEADNLACKIWHDVFWISSLSAVGGLIWGTEALITQIPSLEYLEYLWLDDFTCTEWRIYFAVLFCAYLCMSKWCLYFAVFHCIVILPWFDENVAFHGKIPSQRFAPSIYFYLRAFTYEFEVLCGMKYLYLHKICFLLHYLWESVVFQNELAKEFVYNVGLLSDKF